MTRIYTVADAYGRAIIPTRATVKGIASGANIVRDIFDNTTDRADAILWNGIKRQDRNDPKVAPFGAFDNHGTNDKKGSQLRIRHWTMGYELMCALYNVPAGEAVYLPCYVGTGCDNGIFDAWTLDSEHVARETLGSAHGAIALACRTCNDLKGKSVPAPTVVQRMLDVAAFWDIPRGGGAGAASVRFFGSRDRRTAMGDQHSTRYIP